MLNPAKYPRAPVVVLKPDALKEPISFMLDTGATLNVIKKRNLPPPVTPDASEVINLSGITAGKVPTLGTVRMNIHNFPVEMHVVTDKFPIFQEGILGQTFLKDANYLNFETSLLSWRNIEIPFVMHEPITVPPRTRAAFYVKVANKNIKDGYIPRIPVADGVYLGDAIVRNRNGRAYLHVINTTEKEQHLVVPLIELQEIEKISRDPYERKMLLHTNAMQHDSLSECRDLRSKKTVSDNLGCTKKRTPDDLSENLCVYKSPLPSSSRTYANVCITEIANSRLNAIQESLRLNHLNTEEREHVVSLVENHENLFYLPGDILTCTNKIEHRITTTDPSPVNTKQYRFPPAHKQEINKQITGLLENEVIKPSNSPYNSPLWIVPKKADSHGNKRWRMVIDYRALNEKTIGDAYPLPNITEILDQLGSAKYFSVFDLASGFHQIPMHKADASKTAFSTPHGHYEFTRMPFGLKNAPATFQRLMDQTLSGLQGSEIFVYLDDIVLYASSLKEHQDKFNKLAKRLKEANLKLQPDKCEFLRREVTYLGHIISENGVKPDPNKIKAVQDFPHPDNQKAIKQFLGLAGYYRKFIENFSRIAKPLTDLLKKDVKFIWNDEQNAAFKILRNALCSQPVLQYPDFTRPFLVTTDASGYAIGGVLSQGDIGSDLPIAYTSRLLNDAEKNYSTIEKELLAIVYCVGHFRPYLYGQKFTLITDHKPLVWLHSVKDPTSRLVRWRLKLAEYEYEVIYKAGKKNANADALSRNPVSKDCSDNNDARVRGYKMLPFADLDSSDEERIFEVPRAGPSTNLYKSNSPDSTSRNDEETYREADQAPDHEATAARVKEYSRTKKKEVSQGHSQRSTGYKTSKGRDNDSLFYHTDSEPENGRGAAINLRDCMPERLYKQSDKPCSDFDAESDSDESDSDKQSDASSMIFDNLNIPFDFKAPNVRLSPDQFLASKQNLIIFITTDGNACDTGARLLLERYPNLKFDDVTLNRAKVINHADSRIIALPVKDDEHSTVSILNYQETLRSLLDVITELQLKQITLCKSDVGEIGWPEAKRQLCEILSDNDVEIIYVTNDIQTPIESERREIISEYHCSAAAGHKGVTKTYLRIKEKYSWPNMKRDIASFVKACKSCQLKKLVRFKTKQPMILTDTPDEAFEKVSMDIMGPLPESSNGYHYVLTIQDLLTKYLIAIPLKHAGAIDVADAFVKQYICVFGAPRALLTDQGSHFLNALMRTIARKFRIKHYKTTAYRPQSNGSIERSHHVIWEYLKQFVSQNEWDEQLSLASFSYNTSVHEGTRFTPHELVFGRIARVPASTVINVHENESYADYLINLNENLINAQRHARENLVKAKERSKYYYDRRVNPQRFLLNDKVYLLKELRKNKLSDQYIGPFTIIEVLPKNNVRIRISATRTRIVHTDKLKHCSRFGGGCDAQSTQRPPPHNEC